MSNQLQVSGAAKIRSIQGPVVANSGVITALDGDATQYVRGDGTLADFPTSTGGGSSVSYYLNTSVSQGTIGGVAYKQLSKTPISGAGTDVTISANGYVASYITDANDPALLEVPAGNFNCEFYFSVDSNAHNPYVYAELYKYDGTTFTLLGSSQSVPEYLTNGTTISPYYFAIPVATAVLTITDRIAIRIYVNVDTRTVTLHTENNHLCQVVTTFSKGLISLNNLTRQNQFFATGTTGTDFAISSTTATHTFNLPVASATNTGKLSSTDWSTFNNKVPYTGATVNVDLGSNNLTANNVFGETSLNIKVLASGSIFSTGYSTLSSLAGKFTMAQEATSGNLKAFTFDFSAWATNTSRTFTLPDASGTLALTSNLSSYVPYTGATTNVNLGAFGLNTSGIFNNGGMTMAHSSFSYSGSGQSAINGIANGLNVNIDALYSYNLLFPTANNNYTFPNASGTIALLSADQTFTGINSFDNSINYKTGASLANVSGYISQAYAKSGTGAGSTLSLKISDGNSVKAINLDFVGSPATYTYTFPAATGTLALLESTQTFTGVNTFSGLTSFTFSSGTRMDYGPYLTKGSIPSAFSGSTTNIYSDVTTNNIVIRDTSSIAKLEFNNSTQTYTFPAATGTLPLGTGTTNYHAKWTGTNTIGNSLIWDNGTNVGIGTASPNGSYRATLSGPASGVLGGLAIVDTEGASYSIYSASNNLTIRDVTNAATRVTLTSAGNVGIGVTPASWAAPTAGKVIQLGNRASIFSYNNQTSDIGNNIYFNGADYIYNDTAAATLYRQGTGLHQWFNAPSGTSGTSAALEERMRITSGGYIVTSSVTYGNTTGAAANMYLFGVGDYGIGRSVSSAKYKTQVEDVEKNYVDNIYKMRPIWYRSLCERDRKDWSHFGFIAEEMAEIEPRFVHWNKDEDGNDIAEGVQYDRITALLVAAVQEQQIQIQNLQEQNQDLKSRLDKAGL